MLLPFMGLFMFFIPAGGFLLALVLCFIKRLRFLASFAFFVPLLSAYSALAGFWGLGLGLEGVGFSRWITNVGALAGLLVGGFLGCLAGIAVAFGLNRLVRRVFIVPKG